jgi:hypothetical protein
LSSRQTDASREWGGCPPSGEASEPRSGGRLHFGCWSQPGLHQTPIEDRCFRGTGSTGNSSPRRGYVLETLLCPHPGPLNASGLCRETLLVSGELGGGAATGHLVTHHQAGERERWSNQTVGLRVFGPDAPSQSALHIYKEHRVGSPLRWPVRRQAPALPSGVTRSQSA